MQISHDLITKKPSRPACHFECVEEARLGQRIEKGPALLNPILILVFSFMRQKGIYFVYILRCSDGTYYTGVTNDLVRRVNEHQEGINNTSYTYSRRPIELLFHEMFNEIQYAIAFEKKIKRWSALKKKALINGEYNKLPELAKKKFK